MEIDGDITHEEEQDLEVMQGSTALCACLLACITLGGCCSLHLQAQVRAKEAETLRKHADLIHERAVAVRVIPDDKQTWSSSRREPGCPK